MGGTTFIRLLFFLIPNPKPSQREINSAPNERHQSQQIPVSYGLFFLLYQEVSSLRNEVNEQESKFHFTQLNLKIHEAQLKFFQDNGVLGTGIVSADSTAKKPTLR